MLVTVTSLHPADLLRISAANDAEAATPANPASTRSPTSLSGAPLCVWRFLPAQSMGAETRAEIAQALATAWHGWPQSWRQAMLASTDPSRSVDLAVDFLHSDSVDTARGDEVMSAMVLHALDGDTAAAVVVAHGLAILCHGHPDAKHLMALSDDWSARGGR